jgi:predicted TPR repeat methyltransferase
MSSTEVRPGVFVAAKSTSIFAELRTVDLISPKYCALQRELHARPKAYGQRGYKWSMAVSELIGRFDVGSVLDYGCGQGTLVERLKNCGLRGVRFSEYDPAIVGKDQRPSFADLVVCTDVLEHVEPEKLDTVLTHLRTLARKAVFIVVATVDTDHVMADGRSTHLTIQDGDWWRATLERVGFTVNDYQAIPNGWTAVLLP